MHFTAVFVAVAVAFAQANVAAAGVLGQPAVARAAVKNNICITSNPDVCGANIDCTALPDTEPIGICVNSDAAGLPIPGLPDVLCDSTADCAQGSTCEDPVDAITSLLPAGQVPGLGEVLDLVQLLTNMVESGLPVSVPDVKFCVPDLSAGLPL
ncbi:hypothetical protein C8Q80DRAFT_1161824 [Daedaleopsis nitida]|nr:hypothetical protein C8Q80DRAFT_1161824 [Daedaleopsis nitida]